MIRSFVPGILAVSMALLLTAAPAHGCTLQPDAVAAAYKQLGTQYELYEGNMVFVSGQTFGANPSSLYGVYQFQPNVSSWTLGPGDAVVFYSCAPPSLRYFSFRSYVYTQQGRLVFASLGDSLNDLVIQEKEDPPFDVPLLVVTTADAQTFADVAGAFQGAKIAEPAFADAIPASLVHLGNAAGADTFGMLMRVALFDDPAAGKAYTSLQYPVMLLRAPSTQTAPRKPYPVPVLRNRTTGVSERPVYTGALQALERAVVAHYAGQLTYVATIPSNNSAHNGFDCIEQHLRCAGDNHDAAYLIAQQGVLLTPRTVLVVVGVNHYLTGQAVYSNVEFYTGLQPVGDGLNNFQYAGSAQVFSANATDLFAVHVARDCTGLPFCVTITQDELRYVEPLIAATRAYLNPKTKTGPDYNELVWPAVLQFTR